MTDEKVRFKYRKYYSSHALYWNNLANQLSFELNKQLLGLSSIILPLTASIIAINVPSIYEYQKTLVIVGWILLFSSILSGLCQIIINAIYFNNLSIVAATLLLSR